MGKTVSAWPEADVRRLRTSPHTVGNVLVIVGEGSGWIEAIPVGNRASETVKVYLS